MITNYYNTHYFGPTATHEGKKGERRVFIVFASNAHVVMHRLNEANDTLENVLLVAINMEDTVSKPLPEWNVVARTPEAYALFIDVLKPLLNVDHLQ